MKKLMAFLACMLIASSVFAASPILEFPPAFTGTYVVHMVSSDKGAHWTLDGSDAAITINSNSVSFPNGHSLAMTKIARTVENGVPYYIAGLANGSAIAICYMGDNCGTFLLQVFPTLTASENSRFILYKSE